MADTALQILVHSARAIADWPQLWSRLLATHTEGADGRCRACPSAVQVAPRWPCRIAVLATTAHLLHQSDEAPVPHPAPEESARVVAPRPPLPHGAVRLGPSR